MEWIFVRARTNRNLRYSYGITHVMLSNSSILEHTDLRRVLWSRD